MWHSLYLVTRVRSGMPSLWILPKPTSAFARLVSSRSCGWVWRHWLVYNTTYFGCAWGVKNSSSVCQSIAFLQGNHFAAMYVDDLLALFPQQAAPLMACLCVTLACGLGLPQLSSSIKWIGWSLHLGGLPRAFLPPD